MFECSYMIISLLGIAFIIKLIIVMNILNVEACSYVKQQKPYYFQ